MSASSPLPSLFGRFTSILQEHDRLSKTMRRVRAMCTALDDAQTQLPPELAPVRLLTELCADTFRCDAERAAPLAELLREKTGGNPFFVSHFLSELSKERLVRFDEAKSGWQWDIDEIRSKNFTDNVVELMLAKQGRPAPPSEHAASQISATPRAASSDSIAR